MAKGVGRRLGELAPCGKTCITQPRAHLFYHPLLMIFAFLGVSLIWRFWIRRSRKRLWPRRRRRRPTSLCSHRPRVPATIRATPHSNLKNPRHWRSVVTLVVFDVDMNQFITPLLLLMAVKSWNLLFIHFICSPSFSQVIPLPSLFQLCTPQSLLKSTTIVLATKSSASNNGTPSPPIVFPKVNVKVSSAGEWKWNWITG